MTTWQLIYDTARANGMPVALANLIVAQARHETGDFTSQVYTHCSNLFGYKFAGQTGATRCTLSPERDYYAAYPGGLVASVTELTNWIKRRQKEGIFPANLATITTADKYAQLLKAGGFYGDTVARYANGLQKFAVNFGAPIGLPVIGLVALAIYAARRRRRRKN